MTKAISQKRKRPVKTLLVYLAFKEGIEQFYESYIRRLNQAGFDVEGLCLTIEPPGPSLTFTDLDSLWQKKNKKLFVLYDHLIEKAKSKEILVLYNGANLHPELLKGLNTFNVYMCFDDPESSDKLSAPVAKYFDASFVGNIASLNQYISWGCKNVFFRPLGYFQNNVYSSNVTEADIINRTNDIDVCLFCDRESSWRRERVAYLCGNIANLYGRGRGWPLGWANDDEMLSVYGRSKIGINIHNSTGPINLRTYALPANGIMQICDNKYFLGHIFELDKEVVGYCHIEEVPDLVKFYLKNDALRKKIAAAGWERARKEYNEIAVWRKQMEQIENLT